jgi:hypothetical protein
MQLLPSGIPANDFKGTVVNPLYAVSEDGPGSPLNLGDDVDDHPEFNQKDA